MKKVLLALLLFVPALVGADPTHQPRPVLQWHQATGWVEAARIIDVGNKVDDEEGFTDMECELREQELYEYQHDAAEREQSDKEYAELEEFLSTASERGQK